MRGSTRLGIIMHGADAGMIDLGNEPPLSIGDGRRGPNAPARRAVSWRWLTGTVLTGVTSIGLMGAALMAALNNPGQFASLPEAAGVATAQNDGLVFGRKSDRMRPLPEQVATRQVMQVSTVTRQGERDFIKLKPFAKIEATLGTANDEIANEVPPFDAMSIFADTSAPEPATPAPVGTVAGPGDDQLYGANVDGEIAVKVSAFPIDAPDLDPSADMVTSEIERVVRTAAHLPVDEGIQTAALSFADVGPGDAAADANPLSALGVRIVPENVSSVAKSDTDAIAGGDSYEKVLTVSDNEDLRSLFTTNHIITADTDQIFSALSPLVDVAHLHSGQTVRLAFSDRGDDINLMRVSIYDRGAHQATVARADNNVFVRADEPASAPADFAEAPPETPAAGGLPKLYDAVYQTALEQQIPKPLVDQLIRIFAYDVDFQSRITPGNSLEVFHSLPDASDRDSGDPEILFASLTLNGVTKRFYRFRAPDDGTVDFYDPDGRSAKKFLMRKPVPDARITSRFGYRMHPILHKRILHAGVDYAAPRGTPILAAGDGIVEKAGVSSGYGNLVEIKHTNGYETLYGHQSRFAKGIKPGVRVHQGQIVGYVGSTGMSTGPHVHFEIRINNKPVDPLRIRLPQGRVLQDNLLTAFEHERERIDNLLGNDTLPTKVASAQ